MKNKNTTVISLYYVKEYLSYSSFLVCENAFLRRKLSLLLLLLLLYSDTFAIAIAIAKAIAFAIFTTSQGF